MMIILTFCSPCVLSTKCSKVDGGREFASDITKGADNAPQIPKLARLRENTFMVFVQVYSPHSMLNCNLYCTVVPHCSIVTRSYLHADEFQLPTWKQWPWTRHGSDLHDEHPTQSQWSSDSSRRAATPPAGWPLCATDSPSRSGSGLDS